jgi:hypothetical protein
VKGSYVLDCVFSVSHAKDVDVFFTGDRPTKGDVVSWLRGCGLPEPPHVDREQFIEGGTKVHRDPSFDVHHVESLAKPDGGGEMTFNVDCWYIPMIGQVHIFDPVSGTSAPVNRGQMPGTLALLDPGRDVQTEPGLKGLLKMLLYPQLREGGVRERVVADAAKDLVARPSGSSRAEQAVACLDEMLRGIRPEDLAAARTAVKLAEDELRER